MNNQTSDNTVALPIDWHFPESISSKYATHMIAQYSEHEFIVSFFEIQPPLVLGSPEEKQTQIDQLRSVRGECVARIIIAADRMPEFIRTLEENLESYRSNVKKHQVSSGS